MGVGGTRPADTAPTAAPAADGTNPDSVGGGDSGGGDSSGLIIAMVAVVLVIGLVAAGVRWQRREHDGARRDGAERARALGGRGGRDPKSPISVVVNPVFPAHTASQHEQAPRPVNRVTTGLAAPVFFGVLLEKPLDKAAPPAATTQGQGTNGRGKTTMTAAANEADAEERQPDYNASTCSSDTYSKAIDVDLSGDGAVGYDAVLEMTAGHASPVSTYATSVSTGRARPAGNSETYDHLGDRPVSETYDHLGGRPVQYAVPPGETGHGDARDGGPRPQYTHPDGTQQLYGQSLEVEGPTASAMGNTGRPDYAFALAAREAAPQGEGGSAPQQRRDPSSYAPDAGCPDPAAAAGRASAAAPPAEYAALAPTYVTGASAVGNGPSYDHLGGRPVNADAGRLPVYTTGNTAGGTAGPAPADYYAEAVDMPVAAEYADVDAEGVPVYAEVAEPGPKAGMNAEDGGHVYTEVGPTPVYDEWNDAPTLATLKTVENGYLAVVDVNGQAGADSDEELC